MTVQNDTTEFAADAAVAHRVTLTPAAVAMAKSLREKEGREDLRLRVEVAPGGCRGLSYQLTFDDQLLDGDHVRDFDGMELVVDDFSKDKLVDATIDYVETLQKQGFTIDNPSAQASCACGDSFC
ncbi:MAG: iron-sulfur cluster assembly accessory protein [Kineosporiaceae bacterium]|nr:iron-sulfur cluster assembly accessory protein [Kineosporiaceae bacterium]